MRLLLGLFVLLCAGQALAAEPGAGLPLQQAQAGYDSAHYREAVQILEQSINHGNAGSEIFHLLGKCYGRLAQQAGWLQAMSLARKTRAAFERAVQLDDANVGALRDLMQYYREAPGFLGGSQVKADAIADRLKALDIPG